MSDQQNAFEINFITMGNTEKKNHYDDANSYSVVSMNN